MIVSIALAALVSPCQALPKHLVQFAGEEGASRTALQLGLDVIRMDGVVGDSGKETVLAIADRNEISDAAFLGLRGSVLVEDLAGHYSSRLAESALDTSRAPSPYGASLSPPFGSGGMGGYYTFDEIVSVLDQMRASYPGLITQKESIGTSHEGRDLWMVKISDQPDVDEEEPEVLIDSLHHGREPQSMQATLYLMSWLLEEYGVDPLATYLVNEREIYFVPCVNPDGYEFNRASMPGGGGLWRKNRATYFSGAVGVDLNRNYPTEWATVGSSSDPNSIIYHGPWAGSEPETQAMIGFLGSRDFSTALTVHCFLNAWLAPLAYTDVLPIDWGEIQEVGEAAIELNGYSHAPVPVLLSETGGSSLDYYYDVEGIYTWAPEIGGTVDGFWPAQDRIIPLAEENRIAFARTALAAGVWLRPEGLAISDTGDSDGIFEVGEVVEVTVSVRNSGLVDGELTVVQLAVGGPYAEILNSTSRVEAASFSSASNEVPLSFRIRSGTPDGARIPVRVTVLQGGLPFEMTSEVEVGRRVIAAFDFDGSTNEGWGLGDPNTAVLGVWERVDPNATLAQSETDHTPGQGGLCWVTGDGPRVTQIIWTNVGAGSTSLLSPAIPFDGATRGTLDFWYWFFAEDIEQPATEGFRVDLSSDGGTTWVTAFAPDPLGPDTGRGWKQESVDIGDFVSLSGSVLVRFVGTDEFAQPSLVDIAIDDVVFSALGRSNCPLPSNYCDVSPNGSTAGSSIAAAGSQSLSDNEFQLALNAAPPHAFGLFFFGAEATNSPLGNGRLCVGGTLTRIGAVAADSSGFGVRQVDFGALSNPVLPGVRWNFQCWHRDTVGAGSNTSDAVGLIFCP